MMLTAACIDDLRVALLDKSITAKQLVQQSFQSIAANHDLNCFISLNNDLANQRADWADAHIDGGHKIPLLGIPVAVKDLLLAIGTKTTAASRILENFASPYNSTAVRRLLEAGAVLIGKTNCDEFAMGSSNENSFFGSVLNPWNKDCVSGGSSGGSAVAVASGSVPVALGTDTGGSIRQPASFCGVVGIRPTYGRVSRYGVIAYASSLDQVGVFSRLVKDAAQVLEIISGWDDKDATSSRQAVPKFMQDLQGDIKGLRIGIPSEYFQAGLDPEVEKAIKAALNQLEQLGASLVTIDLPHTKYAVPVYYIIAPAEASSNLSRYDGIRYGYRTQTADNLMDLYCKSRSTGFGAEAQRRILLGTFVLSKGYYDRYYVKARKVQTLIARDFEQAFTDKCDLIAGPVTPSTAFKLGEKLTDPLSMYLNDIYTIPANLAGLPSLSVPCGFDSNGLPVGLQLIANKWAEQTILNVAYAYEQSTDWHLQHPQGLKQG